MIICILKTFELQDMFIMLYQVDPVIVDQMPVHSRGYISVIHALSQDNDYAIGDIIKD